MFTRFVRAGLVFVAVSFAYACGGDVGARKLKQIPDNASRESVLEVLGQGPLVGNGLDEVRVVNGFRRQAFIANGKQYEVIYFREEPGSINDEIRREFETPVVILDGAMIGKGWDYYVELASKEGLPNPLKEK